MKEMNFSRFAYPDITISRVILFAAMVSSLFLSPKWLSPFAAWISPFLWMHFFASGVMHRKWVWGFMGLLTSQLIANWEVNPFPFPILIIMSVTDSLKSILIFSLAVFFIRKYNSGWSTLVLPVLMTAKEFLESFGGGGTWSSIAYSQYSFKWLIQLVSFTGIWGITFLLYWFASVLHYFLTKTGNKRTMPIISFCLLFGIVIVYGAIRYSSELPESKKLISGSLTVPLTGFMESVYNDHFKEEISLPAEMSQSSPLMEKVNSALGSFIENPDPDKFPTALHALNQAYDSLFVLSSRLVESGAQLVFWSEGNGMVLRDREEILIERGKRFAREKGIYLLMPLASFDTGKIQAGKKFLENKTLMISPEGIILNVFYKNKPVPMVEPSEPGDGTIPVIQTSLGKISPSICYDADFPSLIRQAGRMETELLLLPSGDWKAISPYHTYMAVFRAVENGFSLIRQVNHGYSVAVDYRGSEINSVDYFKSGNKAMLAEIPLLHVPTFYTTSGDLLAIASLISAVCILFWTLVLQIRIFLLKRRGEFKKTAYIQEVNITEQR